MSYVGNSHLDSSSHMKGNVARTDSKFIFMLLRKFRRQWGEQSASKNTSQSNFVGKGVHSNAANYVRDHNCHTWLINSAASDHMIGNKTTLTNLRIILRT